MAVIQPLYFPGGRYAASTDRKLLAALLPSEADGTRVSGVIPSYYGTKSMKVAANGSNMELTIQPGICVIPDKATQSADSPGFYLGAIDTSSETVKISSNSSGSTRTDSIYAVVDDTPYTITNKELSSNVAIITTSTAHGFVGGQTVVITGVDNTFDGSYVILTDAPNAPTTYTFRYTKTATNVASTAIVANATANDATTPGTVLTATITKKKLLSNLATITTSAAHSLDVGSIVTIKGVDSVFDGSYEIATTPTSTTFTYVKVARDVAETTISNSYSGSAVARVPFAIKVETGSGITLSGKTKILLAKVSVANGATSLASGTVSDYRQYVTGLGGVHLYDTNSSATGPAGVDGRLRWQTNSTGPTGGVRKLEVYDGVDSAWVPVYDTAGNSHDDEITDASTTAIHHTIGTSATQAAAGNHTHTATNYLSTATDHNTIPKNTTTYDSSPNNQTKAGLAFTTGDSGRVLVILNAALYAGTGTTGYSVRIGTGSTIDGGSSASTVGGINESLLFNGTLVGAAPGYVRSSVIYYVNLTANTSYNACKYFYNSDDTYAQKVTGATVAIVNLP